VPTRFAVPVSGKLFWQTAPGWKLAETETAFKLEPNQPLRIHLQGEIVAGPLLQSPSLRIVFDPGHFRNRFIEAMPFTLRGPDELRVGKANQPPALDGTLDDKPWTGTKEYPLLGLPPRGGRRDAVRVMSDSRSLYVCCRCDDPDHQVEVKKAGDAAEGSRLVLFGEHIRVVLSDGKQTETFAISPEQRLYHSGEGKVDWRAVALAERGIWSAEIAIPRTLFSDWSKVRMNVVHRRQESKDGIEYHLCPAFTLGGDPDRIPDAKAADDPNKFARLILE
jgi:hypothetical protein